ncbi:MAG: hypothetical protein SangKO_031870 [Sandaracinaceae bacterium]
MRHGDVSYLRIGREAYWFGHRAHQDPNLSESAPESNQRPYVVPDLADRPIYGAAIAERSEVRGVRLALFDAEAGGNRRAHRGPWVELVEGQPVPLTSGERGALLVLDRLHWTDGALVLAFAHTPEAVAALPVHVAPDAAIAWNAETFQLDQDIYLHVPNRAAAGGVRAGYRIHNHDALLSVTPVCALSKLVRGDAPADDAALSLLEVSASGAIAAGSAGTATVAVQYWGDLVRLRMTVNETQTTGVVAARAE